MMMMMLQSLYRPLHPSLLLIRRTTTSPASLLRQQWLSTTTTTTTTTSAPFKVAIVGSGPSGCYTAKYLLNNTKQHDLEFKIDVLDRLPTPFGLVRSGVAPDHPEVKNAQNDFTTLFQDNNTALSFHGNVTLGRDVELQELRRIYDVVVLAYGCESNRTLGLEGEESLKGVLSAREFVAWYNAHPDFTHIGDVVKDTLDHHQDDDDSSSSSSSSNVVVIGHGNVALDCARIVAKGRDGLMDTDIAAHALPVLGSGVDHTVIVGRRGHVQGAFTIKEVRELVKLQQEGHNASFQVLTEELELGSTEASLQELNDGPQGRPKKRIDKLLRQAAAADDDGVAASTKQVSMRFLLNPVRLEPCKTDPSRLGAVVCERTRLEGDPGAQIAVGTGEYETIPANLALLSVGYKGIAVPGLEEHFDESRGVVLNTHGKVEDASDDGTMGGLYVSGWLKRGPSGIIGTNIADAKDTVASIVKNLADASPRAASSSSLTRLLKKRNVKVVDWDAYQLINDFETTHTRTPDQPREKIPTHEGLLKAAFETSL